MTGTLDRIEARARWVLDVCEPYTALYPAETAGTLARDVLALVEVAKAAQEMDEKGQTLSFRLRAALARLEDNQ